MEETKYLTTSTFFNHLDDVTKGGYYNMEQSECCICLERQPEVSLPCTHSYCVPCIEEWYNILITYIRFVTLS